jgi:hypothetical protein
MTSNVVIMIIFLVIFIVLVLGMTPIYDFIKRDTKDKTCQVSVIQHSVSKKASPLTQTGTDILCARKEIVFYTDHVEIDRDTITVYGAQDDKKKVGKYRELNSFIVNQVLASELYKCWWKMGAGNVDVFNPDFLISERSVQNPCIICATVSFTAKGGTYEGLKEYLTKHEIASEKTTYLAYLDKPMPDYFQILGQNIPYSWAFLEPSHSLQVPKNVDASKDYIIIFIGYKPTVFSEKLKEEKNGYYIFLTEVGNMNRCGFFYN